ncbi:MAG: TonB-dependent receptor plug domain-containing protein [bacterium]
MKKKVLLSTITLCFSLLSAGLGDSTVLTLPEVVVTAERVPHHIRDLAASVSVVTGEELHSLGARSATDALSFLPGVFVQRTGQFGRTDIDIRGVGDKGTQIAVLIDGRPEKMAIFGCTITHTLPLNNVERIELVRGPLSTLYGSDALGGVVNIITRKATKPLDLSARLSYGSFQTVEARLSAGTRWHNGHTFISLAKDISKGHLPNSQYNGNDITIRAGYEPSPVLGLDFSGKYFTGVKHEPKRATDPETLVAQGWNQYNRGGLDLTLELKQSIAGMVKLYRNFGEHQFDPKDGWHSTDYTNGALLHLHKRFEFENLLQGGIELKMLGGTWIKSDTDKPSYARSQFDIFLADEQTIGPLIATTGVRFAKDNISGSAIVPKFGLVGKLPSGTTIRGSVNKGFRFPPLNYTSVFPPKNPDLKPELSWNYEIGINQEVASLFKLDLSGFILKGENLIEIAPNPTPPPPVRFQNKGSFLFKGLEASLEFNYQFLSLRGSATVNDFGIHTKARPGVKLDAGVSIHPGPFSGTLLFHAVHRYYAEDSSKSPIPSFQTLDINTRLRLVKQLHLTALVENIFDLNYQAFASLPGSAAGIYQMPGRSWRIGIDYGN